jgi:hypothetical protein
LFLRPKQSSTGGLRHACSSTACATCAISIRFGQSSSSGKAFRAVRVRHPPLRSSFRVRCGDTQWLLAIRQSHAVVSERKTSDAAWEVVTRSPRSRNVAVPATFARRWCLLEVTRAVTPAPPSRILKGKTPHAS